MGDMTEELRERVARATLDQHFRPEIVAHLRHCAQTDPTVRALVAALESDRISRADIPDVLADLVCQMAKMLAAAQQYAVDLHARMPPTHYQPIAPPHLRSCGGGVDGTA